MSDPAGSIAALREVRATFADAEQMQDAVSKLSMAGFDRADLGLPSSASLDGQETPESGSKPASTDSDARQARTLGSSLAASAAGLAAAGVTIATGGAAAPAVAAAVAAGGAAGGSVFAVHGLSDRSEQRDRDERAASGALVLAVHAATPEKQSEADAILRAAGATTIEAID
jgi:hypothetical protein